MITEKLEGIASGFKNKFGRVADYVNNPRNATKEMTQRKPPPVKALNVKKPKIGKVGSVDTAFYTKVSAGQNSKLRQGDSIADISAKLLSFIKKHEEDKKLHFELMRDFDKENIQEDERRHNELIQALRKPKKEEIKKTQKEVDKKAEQPTKETKKVDKTAKEVEKETQKVPEAAKPTAPKPAEVPAPKPTATKPAEVPTPKPTATVPKPSTQLPTVAKVGIAGGVAVTATNVLAMPSETVAQAIDKASYLVGVDKSLMYAMANQESGFKPEAAAKTSSAKGLYQFVKKTWNSMVKTYGSKFPILREKSPEDAEANAIAGALYIKENSNVLSKAGIPINATSIYAAHFLGAGGARTLFSSDKNTNADKILPEAAQANKFIFYTKENKPRTVQEVINILYQKVGQYQEKYAQVLNDNKSTVLPTSSETQLAKISTENKDLKTAQSNTIIIDNTSTTIASGGGNRQQQVIRVGSSSDLPIHQQG